VFKLFMKDERGGISAEYVAILALVVLVSITALQSLGGTITGVVTDVTNRLGDPRLLTPPTTPTPTP